MLKLNKSLICGLLFLLLGASGSHARAFGFRSEFTLRGQESVRTPDCHTLIQDIHQFYIAPLHWQKNDWLQLAGVLAIGGGLYLYDGDIQDQVLARKSSFTDGVADAVRWFGDGRYTLPLLGIGYLAGKWRGDSRLQWATVSAVETFFLANSITMAFKIMGHRHRPYTGDGPGQWDGPQFDLDNARLSMPSGHTSSAFAVATALAMYYPRPVLIPVALYGLASLTALSRVNDNKHWVSDIWIGAAIAYFTGKFIFNRHEKAGSSSVASISSGDGQFRIYWVISF